MTTYTSAGDAVEGEQLDLTTRQYYAHRPRRLNGQLLYRFKTGIDSDAEVVEKLADDAEKWDANAYFGRGDRIRGTSIEGKSGHPPRSEIGRRTGAHSGTFVTARGHAHARIVAPLRNIPDRQQVETGV